MAPPQTDPESETCCSYPIIARILGGLCLLGVLLLGLTTLPYSVTLWPCFIVYLILGLTSLFTLLTGFWRFVQADDTGLAWRDGRGTHRARWADIQDYYDVMPTAIAGIGPIIRGSEVVTAGGEKLFVPVDWQNRDRLREIIAGRAVNATVMLRPDGTRVWLAQGARAADFPVSFSYDATALRKERLGATAVILMAVALCTAFIVPSLLLLSYSWLTKYPFLLFCLVACLCLPALAIIVSCLVRWVRGERARRDARARAGRGEHFEARADGLTFYADGEAHTMAWNAIVGYDFVLQKATSPPLDPAPVCRIRSADGREFVFTNRISDFPLLQYLLRVWAPDAIEARKDSEAKDALGGVAARWTGGEEGNGDRVYHCRTRTRRRQILSLGGTGLMGLVMLVILVYRINEQQSFDSIRWLQSLTCLSLLPFAVQSALRFATEKIILRKDGIARRFANRETFLPWSEITDVRVEGLCLHIEDGKGTRIRFNPSQFAHGSEIIERVEEYRRPFLRRAAQADVADGVVTLLPASPAMPAETENYQMVGQ